MIRVELFSKDDCHLCDVARATLEKVRKIRPFDLRVTKIRDGDDVYERFKERVPVIVVAGKVEFQYRISERELMSALEAASGMEP